MPGNPHLPAADGHPVVLFDGVCNLCDSSVQFIIRRDPSGRFRFASLQSDAGRAVVQALGRSPDDLDTMVLVDGDRTWIKSAAALEIARHLTGLWPALRILAAVPRPVRDWGYDVIARHRYRWFGKKDVCITPTPDVRDRFLE